MRLQFRHRQFHCQCHVLHLWWRHPPSCTPSPACGAAIATSDTVFPPASVPTFRATAPNVAATAVAATVAAVLATCTSCTASAPITIALRALAITSALVAASSSAAATLKNDLL